MNINNNLNQPEKFDKLQERYNEAMSQKVNNKKSWLKGNMFENEAPHIRFLLIAGICVASLIFTRLVGAPFINGVVEAIRPEFMDTWPGWVVPAILNAIGIPLLIYVLYKRYKEKKQC